MVDGEYSSGWDFESDCTLVGSQTCYSFDLTLIVGVFLFDRSFASSVVNSTLACKIFEVPFCQTSVSFVAGQPLGYLSSWPLFALSHHWWAAWQENLSRLCYLR
ncbi:hypothetical protein IEQ34_024307 [Dendrobium chrysotoxum]|uniref:Uncharacterized protein n=1 Tax=Dendrobium chrysotoxum TaxID=161865 RepID=A0AAV7FSV3_DENCH|nr:hypothetical protein IEQ34_024307 [Dendrobium chrysotoxum]